MSSYESDVKKIGELETALEKLIGKEQVLERRKVVEKSFDYSKSGEKYTQFLENYKTDLYKNIRQQEVIRGKA